MSFISDRTKHNLFVLLVFLIACGLAKWLSVLFEVPFERTLLLIVLYELIAVHADLTQFRLDFERNS